MVQDWDAEAAIRWGFYANTFVYACVKANAEDAASLAFRAGRDKDTPSDWNPDAPLARLLGPPPGGPNPVTAPDQLIGWSITQLRVAGRFAWEVERDTRGNVVGLWPLVAHRLKPIPSSGGSSYWAGFAYDTGSGERRLSAEQVIYGWNPSQFDWRQPESALQAARLDISVAVMQDRYDYAFLKNDARPAAIVVHEAFAETQDRDTWRLQFEDRFGGPDNAGRVFFAEADPAGARASEAISIHTLGLSQRDAEFIRRYEAKIRAITVGLGTPLSRIGDASGRTFANAHEEMKAYWRHTMLGILRRVENVINMQLAPMLGSEVGWFDLSTVEYLQKPKNYSDATLPGLVQAGIISVNEARAYLGEAPIENPEADIVGSTVPLIDSEQDGTFGDGTPDEITAGEFADDRSEGGVRAFRGESLDLVAYRAADVNLNAIETLEAKWQRAFNKLFARQLRDILRRVDGKRGRQLTRDASPPGPDTVFDPAFWQEQTRDLADDLLTEVYVLAGQTTIARVGGTFDVASPFARAFIGARANQIADNVTDTTYRAIQRELAEGIADGESIPKLADRIRNLFAQTYANRAETVARTEVISAYNGSTRAVGDLLGPDVIAGYRWLATSDDRTRDSHLQANGQTIHAHSGELFQVGTARMAYPGDPAGGPNEVVNCRCTLLNLTPEEMRRSRAKPDPIEVELGDAIERVIAR